MRYTVNYTSGSTGFGWEAQHSSIKEFIGWLEEAKLERAYRITVWDDTLGDFIFWKDVFDKPIIDMIFTSSRDLRTKTKKKLG